MLDFSTALPADLSVPKGSVTYLAPESDDACPAGCALLESGTTLAVRLVGAGSVLRLTATVKGDQPYYTAVFDVDVARSDAAELAPQVRLSQSTPPPYDVPAGEGAGDVFVVVSVPVGYFNPQNDPYCGEDFPIEVYLESIELIELPD